MSANTQMPVGYPCIPVKMGVSLQNASTACRDYDRATEGRMASVLSPHPSAHESKNVTLNPCHALFERQLSFEVRGS